MCGKVLRLNKLIDSLSGRVFFVPMDHGTTDGPIEGIQNYTDTVSQVVNGGADSIILHKGLLREVSRHPELRKMKYILHLSASTSQSKDSSRKVLVSSVEEAIKLGADGVSVHVNIGSEYESDMIRDLGFVSETCFEWQMPLLAMMYSCKNPKKPVHIAHAARIGEELGADIIKINFPDTIEEFSEIIKVIHIPVVVAGGAKTNDPQNLLFMIRNAIEAGASGVAIGRNIFQHENPELFTAIIRNLVHSNLEIDKCMYLLKQSTCKKLTG